MYFGLYTREKLKSQVTRNLVCSFARTRRKSRVSPRSMLNVLGLFVEHRSSVLGKFICNFQLARDFVTRFSRWLATQGRLSCALIYDKFVCGIVNRGNLFVLSSIKLLRLADRKCSARKWFRTANEIKNWININQKLFPSPPHPIPLLFNTRKGFTIAGKSKSDSFLACLWPAR